MSLSRTFAILRKELWHIFRDSRILFLVTVSPGFLLVMLAYVFSFDAGRTTLAMLDLDQSETSRAYATYLMGDGDIEIRSYVSSYAEAEDLLLAGRVDMVVVIPHGFGAGLQENRVEAAEVQLVVDGMNSIAASKGMSGLSARTRMFAARTLQRDAGVALIDVHGRAWYNPALKSQYGTVPGLMAVVLFLPAMSVTLALARERETGSFEGLIATPVRGLEYLTGKLAAYMLTGLVGAVLAWLVAVYWFQVPFRGSLLVFLLLTAVYFFATMGIGLFVANFVKSQQTAMTLILLIFFAPSFFLAGLIMPVDTTSLASLLSSYAFPQTHFITIARAVFLKGAGLAEVWTQTGLLLLTGAGMLALSLLFFKKKVG